MKIAIITAVYHPMINGVAVFSHNLAVGLAKRGHEVLVLCPSQKGAGYCETEWEGGDDGKLMVHYVRAREFKRYPDQIHVAKKQKVGSRLFKKARKYEYGFRFSLWPRKEVQGALDEFRPEVVHVQVEDMIGKAAGNWARKNGVALVETEHNQPEVLVEPLELPSMIRRPAEAFLRQYFWKRLNRGDFATMPTEEAIRGLIFGRKRRSRLDAVRELSAARRGKECKESKKATTKGRAFKVPVAAVSNGVDLSQFRPGKVGDEIYEKYGIKKVAPTVLYVGRVDPEKQVDKVVEAFSIAVKQLPVMQLVVVGDGVALKELSEQAKRLRVGEKVHFLGRVVPPDLYELYRVGDVFATASEIETQGIVLIEAAAVGLPLIAVDKGAVREVCRDGQNGRLLRAGDVEAMSEAMVEILQNRKLAQKFSEASLAVAAEHDFERTLDKFLNIYHKCQKS